MRKEELHFVTRLSTTTLLELIAQLPQGDAQHRLWNRTKLLELSVEGKRYVIAGGEYRQKRDFARRTARLEKAESELKRMAAVPRRKPDPHWRPDRVRNHRGRERHVRHHPGQVRRALQPSVLGAFLQFRDAATVIPEQIA
jgi:hypothetical protein